MTASNMLRITIVFIALTVISGCAFVVPIQKQTLDGVFNIPVSDPVYRRITKATVNVQIKASGEFKPGTYLIKGNPVRIDPHTRFSLELSLPIDNPAVLSTRNANGKLCTTAPLVVKNTRVPLCVVLEKGKLGAYVDIVQTLGAFVVNVLADQAATNERGDLSKMIQFMHVEKAVFDLKPGSFLEFGKKEIHVGVDSRIELADLNIDSNFNYQGKCLLQLNFLGGCKWAGERCDYDFNGGSTNMLLNAKRTNNELTLSLQEKNQHINLEDCVIRWGKNKRSSARSVSCDIALQSLLWKKTQGSQNPALHMAAGMLMQNTHLDLITDTQETDAKFPGTVPSTLKVDIDETGRSTEFHTQQVETAKSARIDINRPTTQVIIYLDDAKIGPLSIDKFGDLSFSLSKGIAKLKQLEWRSAKREFTLATAGPSVLSLPDGMELSSTGKPGGAHMSLPIDLKLGRAVLKGSDGELKLSNLNGTMLVSVDSDVKISSDMDFSMDTPGLIAGRKADVTARGFNLSSANEHAIAEIKSCSIDWPHGALRNEIKDHLPKNKTFNMNKVISDHKWRYKNAILNTVTLKNLQIDDMKSQQTNLITFSASGDVEVAGTIDKGGLMAAITHESSHWETRPWSATGHVSGTGTVKYKLVPGPSLANSAFVYDLQMQLPIPDDIDLDWDAVSRGLMRDAEKAIILAHLNQISVPINYSGKLTIGDATDTHWKNVTISHLVCMPSDKGTKMNFSAKAVF